MVNEDKKVIVDTGPLVAFLNGRDIYHKWAVTHFSILSPPFYTCESVFSEVCFLLRHTQDGPQKVFRILERGLLKIKFSLQAEISVIERLIYKYRNIPMSLADACLVRMSEQITNSVIYTLDSDFKIYRKDKRKIIPVVLPENL